MSRTELLFPGIIGEAGRTFARRKGRLFDSRVARSQPSGKYRRKKVYILEVSVGNYLLSVKKMSMVKRC